MALFRAVADMQEVNGRIRSEGLVVLLVGSNFERQLELKEGHPHPPPIPTHYYPSYYFPHSNQDGSPYY